MEENKNKKIIKTVTRITYKAIDYLDKEADIIKFDINNIKKGKTKNTVI
ncbi:hypothetical protein [Polaribacter sp. SA4-10]|nr:hypothetical protein [Polaribacter sp. SA4-10]